MNVKKNRFGNPKVIFQGKFVPFFFHKECNSSVWGTHSNFKSIIACSALSARCLMVNSIGDINIRVGGWYGIERYMMRKQILNQRVIIFVGIHGFSPTQNLCLH